MHVNSENKIRNNAVFLLRIIATCMVLIVHFGQSLPLPEFILKSVRFGQHGVIIFFVLSGYLIAESLDRNNNIKLFYINRICRIVPVYYTIVIINMFFLCLLGYGKLNWIRYFTFTHSILPTTNWFVWNNWAGMWTMSAFAVFYLIAPLLHKIMSCNSYRKKNLYALSGLSLMSSWIFGILEKGNDMYKDSFAWLKAYSPIVVLYQFVIGMYIFYGIKENREKEYYLPICFLGIFGIIYGEERFVIAAVIGTIFLLITDIRVNVCMRGFKLLEIIEEYSFSIYLGHTTVMAITRELHEIYFLSSRAVTIISLVGSILLVIVLHQVEKLGSILKKYIKKFWV